MVDCALSCQLCMHQRKPGIPTCIRASRELHSLYRKRDYLLTCWAHRNFKNYRNAHFIVCCQHQRAQQRCVAHLHLRNARRHTTPTSPRLQVKANGDKPSTFAYVIWMQHAAIGLAWQMVLDLGAAASASATMLSVNLWLWQGKLPGLTFMV